MEEDAQWSNGWCNGLLLWIMALCSYSHRASLHSDVQMGPGHGTGWSKGNLDKCASNFFYTRFQYIRAI